MYTWCKVQPSVSLAFLTHLTSFMIYYYSDLRQCDLYLSYVIKKQYVVYGIVIMPLSSIYDTLNYTHILIGFYLFALFFFYIFTHFDWFVAVIYNYRSTKEISFSRISKRIGNCFQNVG